MEDNELLRNAILEIVENQIKNNDPVETRLTYKRLTGQGYSDTDARKLIGQCIGVELFHTMKYEKPFNEARYIRNLKRLPEEPLDD